MKNILTTGRSMYIGDLPAHLKIACMSLRKNLISCTYLLLLAVLSPAYIFAQDNDPINSLWKGIGGKSTWANTDYILFTVEGNRSKFLQNGRTFILNRNTGQARLEAKTESNENIVVLFNYLTGKLTRFFRNGKEIVDATAFIQDQLPQIISQLEKDAALLFLPTVLEKSSVKIEKLEQKIVNAEKLDVFSIAVGDEKFDGTILFNSESGLIKQFIDHDGHEYYVNGYKDIGGGLILPTTFKNLTDSNKSTTFTVVASFEELEETKFTNL